MNHYSPESRPPALSQLQSLPSPPMLMTSHSCWSTTSLLNLPGTSHHSYTAGPPAGAGVSEAATAVELASTALASPPFLKRIMGTWGFTVTSLLRSIRLAETEDMMEMDG